jgi:hypothetical protein
MLRWLVTSRMPLRPSQAFWFWRPEAEGSLSSPSAPALHTTTQASGTVSTSSSSLFSLTVCALGKDAYYTC